MRKIIVAEMITLDGVMQAPGGPEEDQSGNFEFGGWAAPFGDKVGLEALKRQLQPADYLLGRKTFEIWEPYWPTNAGDFWPAINEGTKYVYSSTRDSSDWNKTEFIGSVAEIERIKATEGRDLQVWGSAQLVQLLLSHDLVDELWLKFYPQVLGSGKKLFADGAVPASFVLTESTVTTKGVIMANYQRDGGAKTGAIGSK
ncbi:MAG: dihydrofolate reductase [Armatimonadetes bacterium]|nr:dihydrofolate reductase [Armatimonadota bacterium]